jgi:metal-responsive CopG/Arc/MetJ family transcriptional regulator
MPRAKAIKRNRDFTLLVVKVPNNLAEDLDRLVQVNDSDRSKELRKALRERLLRTIPDSRMAAAHA